MIIAELIAEDRVRHSSDTGKYIRQVGTANLMLTAVDVYPCPYEYEEYDGEPPEEDVDADDALEILMGGVE